LRFGACAASLAAAAAAISIELLLFKSYFSYELTHYPFLKLTPKSDDGRTDTGAGGRPV
jgi:hypothetical protein